MLSKRLVLFLIVVAAIGMFTLPAVAQPVPCTANTTYYIKPGANVNVRASASTTAQIVTRLAPGTAVLVAGAETGTAVGGNTTWCETGIDGVTVYVHSSLLVTTAPANAAISTTTTTGGSGTVVDPAPMSTPIPQPTAQPVQQASSGCPGLGLTCGQLGSCAAARACLAAGNQSLDRDKDGIPCESLCGG